MDRAARLASLASLLALSALAAACSPGGDSASSAQGGSSGATAGSAGASTPGGASGASGSAGEGGTQTSTGTSGGPSPWKAAIEVCNGKDDDGDGLSDEDCPPSLWAGAFPPGGGADLSSPKTTQRIEADSGRPLPVIQTYRSTKPAGVAKIAGDLAAIWQHGATPHLNVEPSGYSKSQYAAGGSDPEIASDLAAAAAAIAAALSAHPDGRLLLTFGAEMNGDWTDWGCQPAAPFIALYRKAHDTVSAALAAEPKPIDPRRARWVFGPNSTSSAGCGGAADYYPGHKYNDYLGMSAYRSGTQSVAAAVTAPAHGLLSALALPEAWSRDRFIVLQTGSRVVPGDDRGAWLGDLFSTLSADPVFLGAIYFDAADWAVLDPGPPPAPLAGYTGFASALGALPAADSRLDGTFEPFFWDVRVEQRYYAEIQSLRAAGITSGCSAAPPAFCPDEALPRAAAAIFMARAFGIAADPSGPPMFSDVGAADAGYGEIQALAKKGFLTGCGATTFCPDQPISRAALAMALAALSAPPPADPKLSDVAADDPAAAAIGALAALGWVDECKPGAFCPADPAKRDAGAAWIVRSAGVAPAPGL